MSTATAAIATLARELEGHLLAHGGRRQGRHVRFACPVHPDEHPSADFDPAKATWICRACGVGGGARDLARRLGLDATTWPPMPPRRPRSVREQIEVELIAHERRARARLAPFIPLFHAADFLRVARQRIAEARALVSAAGDHDDVWPTLVALTDRERVVNGIEADVDAAMRGLSR